MAVELDRWGHAVTDAPITREALAALRADDPSLAAYIVRLEETNRLLRAACSEIAAMAARDRGAYQFDPSFHACVELAHRVLLDTKHGVKQT